MNPAYYTIDPQQNFQEKNYSSFQPESSVNKKILVDTGIASNWHYRQYIQKNANQIMKYNTMESIYASGNNPYAILNTEPLNKSPHLYTSVHDTSNPTYGFRNSDLKQDYMSKRQLQSRMISPSIPTYF